ncbi:MAG: 2-C-methyl-D-erythritol 4-phosphate cytidylyltransferase [Proteobacteria bacterium]|nr:2-C-methyl-D-erythritol 4-phosphate cytidylyltransferase [Pseudomonadota bacterium]
MDQNKIDVVVLAAGKGDRMQAGENKIFLPLKGIPIIYRTLSRLDSISAVDSVYLVIRLQEKDEVNRIINTFGSLKKPLKVVIGGKERCDSVMNGLMAITEEKSEGWVMVHDGARPFITEKLILRLLESASENGVVVPALPIHETVRKSDRNKKTQSLERKGLYTMQTPQLFHVSAIDRVFIKTKGHVPEPTDEASFFEFKGEAVEFVGGERWNLKITQQEDLKWAETMISGNRELKLDIEN